MQPAQNTLDQVQRLALESGTPVRKAPFSPWPDFAADEVEAKLTVNADLGSNHPTPKASQLTDSSLMLIAYTRLAERLAEQNIRDASTPNARMIHPATA